jgi:hypothetical protein
MIGDDLHRLRRTRRLKHKRVPPQLSQHAMHGLADQNVIVDHKNLHWLTPLPATLLDFSKSCTL